ncbi:hypothetical protein [Fibrobacter sp. UWH4]|uniref:hypothetical protein n=1 Tax=Fibrobacter sp. UWH4 TaxID=1896210 RepID=UPI0009207DA1|nr:hypothetical protein [Fibrobacter sp. UWH4]SHL45530.1 hypothetical protein SAMN05720762_106135 [Fibrobacter sp. UWH4]
MKYIALAIFLIQLSAANVFAASCDMKKSLSFFPSTSICLFKKDSLNFRNKKNVEPPVVNLQRSGNLWMYRSHLNPMIVVTTDGRRVVLSNICEKDPLCDSLDTHVSFSAVLKDEFLRWQKASVFEGTEQEADSLVSHIIVKMSKAFGEEDDVDEPDLAYIEYNIYCDDTDSAESILGPFFGLNWETPTVLDSLYLCDEYTLKIPVASTGFHSLNIERVSRNTFSIGGIKDFTPYKVFDLNGVLLKQGYVQKGLVEISTFPSILMISDQKVLLR